MINLFYIGQKVVFIEPDAPRVDEWGNSFPEYGCVYTVRSFVEDSVTSLIGIRLEEIVNTFRPSLPDLRLRERAFHVASFRPVSEQDIWKTKRVKELT